MNTFTKMLLAVGSLSFLLLCNMNCFAQSAIPTSDVSSTGYIVDTDDVLSITVMGFSDLCKDVPVLPDGTVSLSLVGDVKVAGLTTPQIQRLLTKDYSKYVISPSVSVAVTSRHAEFVTFSGYVSHQGPYTYRPNLRVIEAIAENGGALVNGDLSKVTVTSSSGDTRTLDLSHPETKAGTDVDIVLNQGDVVYVPEERNEISVVGEVTHPGSFPYVENMSIEDVLTDDSAPLDTADLKSATLVHDGVTTNVDLYALLKKGDMTQNLKLAAGDTLTILPGMRTYVYGAVVKQGFYSLTPGDRILDALDAAGGPIGAGVGEGTSDLAKVRVIQIDKTKNKADVQVVNVAQFLRSGDEADNVVLQPGDVLFVPAKGHKFELSDMFGVLQGLDVLNTGATIVNHGLGY
jgi:polysaccharide export outer membrane protein